MPLDSSSIFTSITWQHYRQNDGFLNTNQGPDALSMSVELDDAEDVFAESKTIGTSTTVAYDLTSLTNLLLESVSISQVLALMVSCSSGSVTLSPGATNGATLFMGGTTPGIVIPANGVVICSTGVVVDSTHKNLTIASGVSSGAAYQFAILGGA